MKTFINSIKSLVSLVALLMIAIPQFSNAGTLDMDRRYVELYEVNFPANPDATATIRISKKVFPEDNPNYWEFFENQTTWSIAVTGLHCNGNHQQPDGHAEWTRQSSYALYINGLRLITFSEGCARNQAFGDYKTVIEVFVPLPFDPFIDNLVAEVVPENDDGWGTCDGTFPCDHALLRGEDIITP